MATFGEALSGGVDRLQDLLNDLLGQPPGPQPPPGDRGDDPTPDQPDQPPTGPQPEDWPDIPQAGGEPAPPPEPPPVEPFPGPLEPPTQPIDTSGGGGEEGGGGGIDTSGGGGAEAVAGAGGGGGGAGEGGGGGGGDVIGGGGGGEPGGGGYPDLSYGGGPDLAPNPGWGIPLPPPNYNQPWSGVNPNPGPLNDLLRAQGLGPGWENVAPYNPALDNFVRDALNSLNPLPDAGLPLSGPGSGIDAIERAAGIDPNTGQQFQVPPSTSPYSSGDTLTPGDRALTPYEAGGGGYPDFSYGGEPTQPFDPYAQLYKPNELDFSANPRGEVLGPYDLPPAVASSGDEAASFDERFSAAPGEGSVEGLIKQLQEALRKIDQTTGYDTSAGGGAEALAGSESGSGGGGPATNNPVSMEFSGFSPSPPGAPGINGMYPQERISEAFRDMLGKSPLTPEQRIYQGFSNFPPNYMPVPGSAPILPPGFTPNPFPYPSPPAPAPYTGPTGEQQASDLAAAAAAAAAAGAGTGAAGENSLTSPVQQLIEQARKALQQQQQVPGNVTSSAREVPTTRIPSIAAPAPAPAPARPAPRPAPAPAPRPAPRYIPPTLGSGTRFQAGSNVAPSQFGLGINQYVYPDAYGGGVPAWTYVARPRPYIPRRR